MLATLWLAGASHGQIADADLAEGAKAAIQQVAGGEEVGAVLEGSTSEDGKLAVLYTIRKKGAKPPAWPVLREGADVKYVNFEEGDFQEENWVVSLPEKKRLALVKSSCTEYVPFYDHKNHGGLSVFWGPVQEGWRFGLITFWARFGTADLFLVDHDGEAARMVSIRKQLDARALEVVARKREGAGPPLVDEFVVVYEPMLVINPAAENSLSEPLDVEVKFTAEVPHQEADVIEGTIVLRLSRAKDGASAEILEVRTGPGAPESEPPAPAAGASPSPHTADDFERFRVLRQEVNDRAEKGALQDARVEIPTKLKGHDTYVKGWYEANVLHRLMHVDSWGDDNETVTFYYWREGRLTSVFQVRNGPATGVTGVTELKETWDFQDEKLVGWKRSPGEGDGIFPYDASFGTKGEALLAESIALGSLIYSRIGAD